jgi:hypothetical protein
MRGKTPNKPLGKAFMDNMSEIDEGQKDEHEENGGMVMFSVYLGLFLLVDFPLPIKYFNAFDLEKHIVVIVAWAQSGLLQR